MFDVVPLLSRVKGAAVDILFPLHCLGCRKEGSLICPSCARGLPRIETPVCRRCGIPQADGLCPACAGRESAINGFRAPFRFEGTVRLAVHQLKYNGLRAAAEPLAELLRDYLTEQEIPADVLLPVPLHRSRLRQRGYNQAALLAGALAALTGLTLTGAGLLRQQVTPAQARTTSVTERWQNMAGAFTPGAFSARGRKILLIDDVITSGATMEACAGVLKEAGAESVWGLALAREI